MRNHKTLPSRERLKELFTYDMGAGEFYWKEPRGGRTVGRLAGTLNKSGYRHIVIDSTSYLAHRLAWMRCHNQDPGDMQVDHIDGNPSNNHIGNLRLVYSAGNQRNASISRHNTSGFNGVHWHKAAGKWAATMHVGGKVNHLGTFTSKDDAIAARQAANERHGFHQNHGRATA
ncbi:HNH endonuclease [Luminiphilus sp.]|nr:HNH endonuclease [Luminiphilus sp.]